MRPTLLSKIEGVHAKQCRLSCILFIFQHATARRCVDLTGSGAIKVLKERMQQLSSGQLSALQHTFVTGFHAAFIACTAVAAIGILTSLVRGNEKLA